MDALTQAVQKLIVKEDLTETEAQEAIGVVMRGQASETQLAALLTAWRAKGFVVDELVGAARTMRGYALRVSVRPGVLVDTCGTGGDDLGTFNISTVAAFVVAGAGIRVAKHGNRAVTSSCGSADLLTELGVTVDVEPEVVSRCINEVGIGFMFAPRFHPAMKHAAPVRKALGFKTIFNFLGPLTNPAGVKYQLVGVSDPNLLETVAETLKRLGSRRVLVVCGEGGMDEVSLSGPTQVVELDGGELKAYSVSPEQFGLTPAPIEKLQGGSVAVSAGMAEEILQGKGGPPRDAVLLNAGAALHVSGSASDIPTGISMAKEALKSGRALEKLEKLKAATQSK